MGPGENDHVRFGSRLPCEPSPLLSARVCFFCVVCEERARREGRASLKVKDSLPLHLSGQKQRFSASSCSRNAPHRPTKRITGGRRHLQEGARGAVVRVQHAVALRLQRRRGPRLQRRVRGGRLAQHKAAGVQVQPKRWRDAQRRGGVRRHCTQHIPAAATRQYTHLVRLGGGVEASPLVGQSVCWVGWCRRLLDDPVSSC